MRVLIVTLCFVFSNAVTYHIKSLDEGITGDYAVDDETANSGKSASVFKIESLDGKKTFAMKRRFDKGMGGSIGSTGFAATEMEDKYLEAIEKAGVRNVVKYFGKANMTMDSNVLHEEVLLFEWIDPSSIEKCENYIEKQVTEEDFENYEEIPAYHVLVGAVDFLTDLVLKAKMIDTDHMRLDDHQTHGDRLNHNLFCLKTVVSVWPVLKFFDFNSPELMFDIDLILAQGREEAVLEAVIQMFTDFFWHPAARFIDAQSPALREKAYRMVGKVLGGKEGQVVNSDEGNVDKKKQILQSAFKNLKKIMDEKVLQVDTLFDDKMSVDACSITADRTGSKYEDKCSRHDVTSSFKKMIINDQNHSGERSLTLKIGQQASSNSQANSYDIDADSSRSISSCSGSISRTGSGRGVTMDVYKERMLLKRQSLRKHFKIASFGPQPTGTSPMGNVEGREETPVTPSLPMTKPSEQGFGENNLRKILSQKMHSMGMISIKNKSLRFFGSQETDGEDPNIPSHETDKDGAKMDLEIGNSWRMQKFSTPKKDSSSDTDKDQTLTSASPKKSQVSQRPPRPTLALGVSGLRNKPTGLPGFLVRRNAKNAASRENSDGKTESSSDTEVRIASSTSTDKNMPQAEILTNGDSEDEAPIRKLSTIFENGEEENMRLSPGQGNTPDARKEGEEAKTAADDIQMKEIEGDGVNGVNVEWTQQEQPQPQIRQREKPMLSIKTGKTSTFSNRMGKFKQRFNIFTKKENESVQQHSQVPGSNAISQDAEPRIASYTSTMGIKELTKHLAGVEILDHCDDDAQSRSHDEKPIRSTQVKMTLNIAHRNQKSAEVQLNSELKIEDPSSDEVAQNDNGTCDAHRDSSSISDEEQM